MGSTREREEKRGKRRVCFGLEASSFKRLFFSEISNNAKLTQLNSATANNKLMKVIDLAECLKLENFSLPFKQLLQQALPFLLASFIKPAIRK